MSPFESFRQPVGRTPAWCMALALALLASPRGAAACAGVDTSAEVSSPEGRALSELRVVEVGGDETRTRFREVEPVRRFREGEPTELSDRNGP